MSYYKGKPKVSNKETVKQIIEYPIKAIPERGLTQETCQAYGIRTAYNQETGEPEAHYFPHYKGDKIVGFVRRDLLQPKKDAWSIIGEVNIKSELFGQHVGNDTRKITIVEGMYDAPSAYQVQMDSLKAWEKKEGKKTGIKPSVVSISLGTKNAKEQIGNNLTFINEHSEVVLCFDSDEATPEQLKKGELYGQDAVMQVSMLLPDMKNIVLDKKDPNEYLVEGKPGELAKLLKWGAKDYSPSSIAYGAGDLDDLLTPIPEGLKVPEFPKLMNLLKGFRPEEFTIILAPPKCGKTSLIKVINYSLLKQGHKVFGFYLEEGLKKTRQSFLAHHAGMPLPVFRTRPDNADKALVREASEKILKDDTALFYDDKIGKIHIDNVMPTLEWAANQGVDVIVLDHFQFIVANSKNINERQTIDNLMNEVASFCKRTGVHVIGVTHITFNKNYIKPKNEDGTVKYPHWYEVGEHDGRGSSAFAHVCSNMIAIDKEYLEDGKRGRTRLKVLYNREWDYTGVADILSMDKSTGRLESVG